MIQDSNDALHSLPMRPTLGTICPGSSSCSPGCQLQGNSHTCCSGGSEKLLPNNWCLGHPVSVCGPGDILEAILGPSRCLEECLCQVLCSEQGKPQADVVKKWRNAQKKPVRAACRRHSLPPFSTGSLAPSAFSSR